MDQTTWFIFLGLGGLYVIYMVVVLNRRQKASDTQYQDRFNALYGIADKKSQGDMIRERLLKETNEGEGFVAKFTSKIKRIRNMELWLKSTGKAISVRLFMMMNVVAFAGAWIGISKIFAVPFPQVIPLSLCVSAFLCFYAIQYLIGKQKKKFLELFPDSLDLIRRALRAGYTPDRAMLMVAEEAEDPVGPAFREVVDRVKVGDSMELALADTANRLDLMEFHLLAIVLVLQRETGGSLADVIENFSKIMRDRQRLIKKVRAITAEGKASGYMVSSIPLVIILVLSIISPGYLDPLFSTPTGHNLLIIGGGMMIAGIGIIYRMINKEYY